MIKPILAFTLVLVAASLQASPEVLALFESKCAECHKADGESPTLGKSISVASLSAEVRATILKRVKLPADAKRRMPQSKGPVDGADYRAPLAAADLAVLEAFATAPVQDAAPSGPTPAPPTSKPSAIPAGFNTHCPIDTHEEADPGISVEYAGKTVYFCCQQCKKLWQLHANYVIKARPSEALPQFKELAPTLGLDTITLLSQRYCPVREGGLILPGAPSVTHEGKKVFLYGADELEDWKKDPAKYAAHISADGSVPAAFAASAGSAPGTTAPAAPVAAPPVAPGVVAPATVAAPEGSLEAQAQALLQQRCAECHEKRKPLLHARVSLASLANAEAIIIGDAANSKIIQRVLLPETDVAHMPLSEGAPGSPDHRPSLTQAEVSLLTRWINGQDSTDAPRQLISMPSVLQAIHQDLMAQVEGTRPFLRYLTLTNLYNARLPDGKNADTDSQMDIYRAAVSKLLNSLSWAGRIAVPQAIDPARTVFRLDIRHYAILPEVWEKIVSFYPYGVEGYDQRMENVIRRETHSAGAYLRADWFVFATAQEPLYHTILGLPEHEFGPQGLEAKLGFSTLENLRHGRAVRAAFSPSGVSRANRLIERHSFQHGGYWKSYDFARDGASSLQDLSQAPLGPKEAKLTSNPHRIFDQDGGEIIFHLPNGLQAYYLSKADGQFLPRAPGSVVQDKSGFRADEGILNGISCIVCHAQGLNAPPGQTPTTIADQFGPLAKKTADFADGRLIEKLFAPPAELRRVVQEDVDRFRKALAEATPGYTRTEEPIGVLYGRFNARQGVPASQIASEFYLSGEDLVKELKDTADERLFTFAGKLEAGVLFSREEFLRFFPLIAGRLGFSVRHAQPLALEEFGGVDALKKLAQETAPLAPFVAGSAASAATAERAVAKFPDGHTVTLTMGAPSFRIGQSLSFTLQASVDCHVRVTQFGADGSTTQLLPNAHDTSTRLRAGQSISYPAKAKFNTTPPDGAESLLLEASTQPFQNRGSLQKGAEFLSVDRRRVINSRGAINIVPISPGATAGAAAPTAQSASASAGYRLLRK